MVRSVSIFVGLALTAYITLVAVYRLGIAIHPSATPAPLGALDPYATAERYSAVLNERIREDAHSVPVSAQAVSFFYKAPLDTRLFTTNLIFSLQAERLAQAKRLATHLLKLDPRSRVALLAHFQEDALIGDYDDAISRLDRLIALDLERGDIYVEMIATFYQDPRSQISLTTAMGKQPAWGQKLISNLIRNNPGDLGLIDLVKPYPKLHSRFVASISEAKGLEQAYTVFLSLLPEAERLDIGKLYNPNFQSRLGASPFNWVISEKYAGLEDGGGLAINYYGQSQPQIAWQILRLDPGSYDLTMAISGSMFDRGGTLRWTILCEESRQELANYELMELAATVEVKAISFDVPPTQCSFQRLRLSGVAGTFPRTLRAVIESVRIDPNVGRG